jgi:Uma2 family endonuclease
MFERYTEKARRVIFFARYEASQFGSLYIETEHVLLGLFREDKALTHRFLRSYTSVESIRNQIEGHTTVGEKISVSVDLPLSGECKHVLTFAAEEAKRLSDKHIGTQHLLLGLLREEKCFAAALLQERGLRLSIVREELARNRHEEGRAAAVAPRQVSLGEYLTTTSYEPDYDYVDGELERRNAGEQQHSAVMAFFVGWLAARKEQWKLEAYPAIRIQVSPTRVRVADIAILPLNSPFEGVLTTAPVAVVEVLSPEDRVSHYQARLDDYRSMGVANIWVIDPMRRKAYDCSQDGWQPVERLRITTAAVDIPLEPLWKKPDALHS